MRSYPGPLLWRASRIPYALGLLVGRLPFDVLALHRRYGAVVRIAPDELVFADARAWRDIMGHRPAGEPEMEKAEAVYRVIKSQPTTILNARREEHGRLRRHLAHGFSERSMREQQPIILGYVDLLIRRLRENCAGGAAKLDMVKWYNYTTFDIIGDLAFGESFGCLENSQYHPWVAMIFQSIKLGAWLQVANQFPLVKPLLLLVVPRDLVTKRRELLELTEQKVRKRMALGAKRPDFVEGLLQKKAELGMDMQKLHTTASLLIAAGSETTATALAGASYLLARHPAALARLAREVRTSFAREEDMDFVSVSRLPYMLACLDETLRVYPPAPPGMPRDVPKGGANIAGHWVPENVSCCLLSGVCRFFFFGWLTSAGNHVVEDNGIALPLCSVPQRQVLQKARRVPPGAVAGRP